MTATTTAPAYYPVNGQTNSIFVIGAVARDPEVQATKGGTQIVRLTVAGDEVVTDENGKQRRLPFYETATFIGFRAEKVIAKGFKAGQAVALDGRFVTREVPKKNGGVRKQLEAKYEYVRRVVGFEAAERVTDAVGGIRLVGGVAKATYVGRLTRDGAELMYVGKEGNALLKFTAGLYASWKGGDGVKQKEKSYIKTTVWGQYAEDLAKLNIDETMEVIVEGRPQRGKYQDKDGETVYTLEVTAERVFLLEGEDFNGGNSGGGRGASLDDLPPMDGFGGGFGGLDIGDGDDQGDGEDLPF